MARRSGSISLRSALRNRTGKRPERAGLCAARGSNDWTVMLCPSCLKPSAPATSFCVSCGVRLVDRPEELRRDALGKVRWLLAETYAWPSELVTDAARHALRDHYREREAELVAAMSGKTRPGVAPPPPRAEPRPVVAEAPEPPPAPIPVRPEAPPVPEEGPMLGPPRPTLWQRHLQPFLTESVGWFIGAFLILSGTLYFVADAWAGMSSTLRAFTVFGFAAGWTLVFAAWARFLGRRPVTEPAARALWRIAAVIAPLASVALGAAEGVPVLVVPVLLAWSAVAGLFGWRVSRDADEEGAAFVGVSAGVATLVLGAAPWLATLGAGVTWLALVPAALAVASWRKGPRARGEATAFALAAMAWPVLLVAVRLHVALGAAATPGVHAVTAALLGLGALRLRAAEGRRAADALSVVVVAAQGALLVPAFFAPAPTFVVAALLALVTCVTLARERVSVASARWLFPAYVFGYVAFQHVDQLVPDVVVRAFQALKAALGYASAPLPASYASVYAALFVVAVGVYAALRYRSSRGAPRAEASVLLSATAGGATFFGLLALASLGADARPALIACPLLAALGLALGAWLDRRELTWSGSVVSVAAGLAFAAGQGAALPAAAFALVLALRAVPATKLHRLPAALAALLLAGLAIVTVFAGARADASTLAALALAAGATLLVARTLEVPGLLELACLTPLLLPLHLGSPLLLAAVALAGALALPPLGVASRRRALALAVATGAVGALAWRLSGVGDAWLGVLWLTTASSLGLVARRALSGAGAVAVEVAAVVAALFALVPAGLPLAAWPFLSPGLALAACGALALAASVHAVRRGRSWRSALWAAGAVVMALVAAVPGLTSAGWEAPVAAAVAAAGVVALLATGALWPAVTVTLAALCLGVAFVRTPTDLVVLAAVASVVALLEEAEWTWRALLNRAPVAWTGVVVAAMALGGAVAWGSDGALLLVASVLLPAAWVRATGWPGAAAFGVGFTAVLGVRHPGLVSFAAPALALLWGRALAAWAPARRFFSLRRDGHALTLLAAVGAAAASAALVDGPWRLPLLAAWTATLVVLRDRHAVVRLVAAAALAAAWPGAHLVAPAAFLGLAFLSRHRPEAARRLVGSDGVGFLTNVAALLAVTTSVAALAWGVPGAQAALAVSLAGAALLLQVPALLAAALLLLGVDVRASVLAAAPVLLPGASAAALGLAALAALQRRTALGEWLSERWAALGGEAEAPAAPAWWAALGLGAVLAWLGAPVAAGVALALLVTTRRHEAALALALLAGVAVRLLPWDAAAVALAVGGAALAWLGALRAQGPRVAQAWHHAGWVAALLALGLVGLDVETPAFAVAWAAAAVTAWAVARAPGRAWLGWAVTALSVHAVLAYAGLALSTGAPRELILPWFALGSSVVAALAWKRTRLGGALAALAVLELLAALALVPGAHPREALAAVLASVVLGGTALKAAVLDDDETGAVLGQVLVVTAVLAVRRLGFGATPDGTEAWLAVVLGAVLAGLSRFLAREERPAAAAVLRGGATLWPLVGLVVAPWSEWRAAAPLLAALAVHFTWLSRCGARRLGPVFAALAFNAAVAVAFLGAGGSALELLAIPAGLSLLALLEVFRAELSEDVRAKLRGLAMAAIYGATALRPLAFPTTWGLVLCAVTCVAGVGVGVVFRIRSYVLLGTVFLVTTVVATLVRYGVQEPRLGALFLSALGLVVVAVMVVVTTRRAQVQAQLSAMQRMLAQWEA